VKYTVIPELDLTAAYYGYHQNAYGTGADAGCSTNASGTCSGTEDDISFDADYRLTYDLHTTDDGRPSIQVLIGGKFQPRDP
jgi:hypothetical protein